MAGSFRLQHLQPKPYKHFHRAFVPPQEVATEAKPDVALFSQRESPKGKPRWFNEDNFFVTGV